ncbi:AI-2E family transporter [Acidipila sp. EB88]|uniref:AI-2E family transporter n=1 Tax=Acidipila sp. EB88 TaxID=2305226 RepID=UPI000F5E3249|nr:AI-2E family transporter [Acidipila sp. EB88]RRA48343.1 AI-2E family transporter [Acidipila sp. EB88]
MPLQDRVTPSTTHTFLDDLWDPRVARVLSTTLIFLIVLAFVHAARETLTLFLFAILFAYFLAPLVSRLEKPLRGRGRAILVVYAVLIGVLVGVGFIAGPAIGDESRELTMSLPSLLDRLGSGQLIQQFGQAHHLRPAVVNQIQGFLVSHRTDILGYGKVIGSKIAEPAQHIWWLILIPILSIFFLRQGEEIAQGVISLGRSRDERTFIEGFVTDINVMLGSYIRAQIILACLTLVAYTVVLSVLRVPYAFILGPVAGFLEFIPVVGPAVGSAGIVVIAILSGYPHAIWLVLFLGIWRLVQDYISAPRIMGKSLEINPLLQIFSVLVGGEAAGVVGALIAVPVTATLRILAKRIRMHRAPEAPESNLVGPTGSATNTAATATIIRPSA